MQNHSDLTEDDSLPAAPSFNALFLPWVLVLLLIVLCFTFWGISKFNEQKWKDERVENHRLLEALRSRSDKTNP